MIACLRRGLLGMVVEHPQALEDLECGDGQPLRYRNRWGILCPELSLAGAPRVDDMDHSEVWR